MNVLLFSYNFKWDFNWNFFVEVESSSVVTHFFDSVFNHDELAIDVVTEFFKSFSNLDSVHWTEDSASSANFSSNSECYAFQWSSKSFSISFDFSKLVSALTLIFGKNFKSWRSSNYSFALGDEVVTTIAAFYFYNIIFLTKIGNVFFKNNLHNSLAFKII